MKHAKPTFAAIALGAVSAVGAVMAIWRARVPMGDDSSAADNVDVVAPKSTTKSIRIPRTLSTIDLPSHVIDDEETGRDTAKRVRKLLKLRSRLDRVAWNTLGQGSYGSQPMPGIRDWTERCMFLVSVGIAFEDMPEVLERALADPEGTSARGSLLRRTVEAYCFLGAASVPERWSHDAMGQAWRELCDAIADIIGQEPDYGTQLPPPPPVR